MILGFALVVLSLAVRAGSLNRHIRARAATSALTFAAYGVLSLVLQRARVDAGLAPQLQTVRPLFLVFGLTNLLVTLAFNPWRADRVSERVPNVVQDAIIIALFALASTFVVGRDFLAAAAAGAVIVGIALQDTLGNLFSGLAIQIEKPFQVGHWVSVGGQDGLVSEVTWRATKLRTKAGNLIVVPNSVVAKETIVNYSEPSLQLRLDVDVGASYDAAPNDVKAVIRRALVDEPLLDHSRDIDVLVADFAPSAVTYRVRVWATDFAADERIRDAVRSRIYYAFRRRGIVIPYPVQVQINADSRMLAAPAEDPGAAEVLKATAIFSALTDDQRAELLQGASSAIYAAGETIVRQNEAGSSLFVVCRGEVRVGLDGSGTELARLGRGDYFGEMSLLTGDPRNATVAAVGDALLLEIGVEHFRRVVLNDPSILERMSGVMTKRREELERYRAAMPSHADESESPVSFMGRVRQFLRLSVTP